MLLEEVERLVQGEVRADGVVRLLGDRAQLGRAGVTPGGDDLADERLPRHHTDEAAAVADEERAHLAPQQRLSGRLRCVAALELRQIDHHRIADPVRHYG